MTNSAAKTSPLGYARVAGLLYLIIPACGAFCMMNVPFNILVPGDATATANNILASELLFCIGIVSGSILFLSVILLLPILYVLFNRYAIYSLPVAALSRLAMPLLRGSICFTT